MSVSRRDFLAALAVTPVVAREGAAQRARTAPSVSPAEAFGAVQQSLRATADKFARPFPPGGELRLEGLHGAYASSFTTKAAARGLRGQAIAADGTLTFAVDVAEPSYVSGELVLLPDINLLPGLRATVLSDNTVVAAPMVSAASWGTATMAEAAPRVAGTRPGRGIALPDWLLTAGRHYLTIGGPHTRPAGVFQSMTLQARTRSVREPIYSFAFIADVHVGGTGSRRDAANRIVSDASGTALRAALSGLNDEGVAFAILGGDVSDQGTRDQFDLVADTARSSGCPAYVCLGTSDVAGASSRADAASAFAEQMPGATSGDYTFTKAPIRFVVMEPVGSDPEVQAKKQQWLVETLAADRRTPTVFVWHAAPYNRGGLSSCGYRMPERSELGRRLILDVLQRAPNVFATLNGEGHWDEVDYLSGITHVQNAAFGEWPNTYRVFRVYADRVEWETRQIANRGLVRESLIPAKGLTWMIATRETDTTGQAMLRRPAPSA